MDEGSTKTIDDLFEEGTPIDDALRQAVREALLRHKKLGQSIAVWEKSRVVWIPPESIQVGETNPESDRQASDA